MKKGWKRFWIVITILVVLGIICGSAAIALGFTIADLEGDFTQFIVQEETMTVTEEISQITRDDGDIYEFEDVSELDIHVGACEVLIRAKDIRNVQVDISKMRYDTLGLELRIEEADGKLSIQTMKNGNVWDNISAKHKNGGQLRIYVPVNMILENVDWEFGACEVDISGMTINQMSLMIGAADCEMENMLVTSLLAEVGAGNLEYSGAIVEKVSVDCGAGDVDLNLAGKEEDFNYNLSAGLGEIEIGNKEYGGLAVDEKIDNRAAKAMVINCGAGSVSVDFK